MKATMLSTPEFDLQLFHKGLVHGHTTLFVYIEGDGEAWKNKYTISKDPTPKNPLALKLAVRDEHPAVLYIARPCQFQKGTTARGCHEKYWTSHRYAENIVNAINYAIDWAVQKTSAASLVLIGYSGGGSLAALISARRTDINALVTVAANLDHEAWTNHHQISPLFGSLNAANIAHNLSEIPQLHLSGSDDAIVPEKIILSFMNKLPNGSQANQISMQGFDHDCCWEKQWPDIYCQYLQAQVASICKTY